MSDEEQVMTATARGLARRLAAAREALRIAGVDLAVLLDEGDMTDCPYWRRFHLGGEGVCDRGCWSEPRCITDEPMNGWPLARVRAAALAEPKR